MKELIDEQFPGADKLKIVMDNLNTHTILETRSKLPLNGKFTSQKAIKKLKRLYPVHEQVEEPETTCRK